MNIEVEYRTIERFVGYRFGSDGSIWSSRRNGNWKRLRQTLMSSGYLCANLLVGGKFTTTQTHRLILEAFRGPCPHGMEACHGPDNTRSNNAIGNLRWSTRSDNNSGDKANNGTLMTGEKNHRAKLTEVDVAVIRELRSAGRTLVSIASEFGVDSSNVALICKRRTWKAAS